MVYKFGDSVLYEGDTLKLSLSVLEDESVDLLLIDPPYNIGKGEWDTWPTEQAYQEFLAVVFLEANRVLKKSGSAYIFHQKNSDVYWIGDHITKTYNWNLKQFIIWNKYFPECEREGFLKGYIQEVNKNRNYPQLYENILFFTKQLDYFKNPFVRIMEENMSRLGLTQTHLSKLVKSKNGTRTGWASTKLRGIQLPTTHQWEQLCKLFDIEYKYDFLKEQYESERYYFSPQGNCHSVWNYSVDWRNSHPTPKPVELYTNIIKHSLKPGGLMVDFFAGSGNIIKAAIQEDSKLITFERDEQYVKSIVSGCTI